jgi:hypothetical protein
MNKTLIEEARIIINSAGIALERVKDPADVEAIREMLKETDNLLAQDSNEQAPGHLQGGWREGPI